MAVTVGREWKSKGSPFVVGSNKTQCTSSFVYVHFQQESIRLGESEKLLEQYPDGTLSGWHGKERNE